MLRDSGGVAVRYGNQRTWGHFDKVDTVLLENETGIKGADWQVVVSNAALTGLLMDAAITVDGTDYTIRKHMLQNTDERLILLANA
jgi:hypothetical protein